MSENRVVVVTGATGRQGGAAARALLSRGWAVRALVRDPDKGEALALKEAGAILFRGDLDDVASLDAALAGAYGVFSVQTFTGPDGLVGEVRQGKAVAAAAARAGVAHFVYSSVGGADRPGEVRHFATKGEVERHIEALGLPATILRPTFFITNFEGLGPQWAEGSLVLTLAVLERTRLQMITPADIGNIAAEAFGAPADYLGRVIEIAGDELTGPQMAEVFSGPRADRCASTPSRSRRSARSARRWPRCSTGSTPWASWPTSPPCATATLPDDPGGLGARPLDGADGARSTGAG